MKRSHAEISPLMQELSAYIAGAINKRLPSEVAERAIKFDARQVRFLLSYAAQQACGMATVYRDTEHIEKAFMSGMPAHNGVAAALVVEQGFTGVEDVFSGEHNFFSTFAPDADRTQLTRGLGRDYEILHCGIKRWSSGGPIQAPLHVLYELIKQHGFKANDVQKLVARMPANNLVSVNNREMPDICVQHLLAVMLLDGTVSLKFSHDYARMKDVNIIGYSNNMTRQWYAIPHAL